MGEFPTSPPILGSTPSHASYCTQGDPPCPPPGHIQALFSQHLSKSSAGLFPALPDTRCSLKAQKRHYSPESDTLGLGGLFHQEISEYLKNIIPLILTTPSGDSWQVNLSPTHQEKETMPQRDAVWKRGPEGQDEAQVFWPASTPAGVAPHRWADLSRAHFVQMCLDHVGSDKPGTEGKDSRSLTC